MSLTYERKFIMRMCLTYKHPTSMFYLFINLLWLEYDIQEVDSYHLLKCAL